MQMVESFLSFLKYERRYSAHTISAYETDLNQCGAYLEETFELSDWNQVESGHLRRWLVSLSRKGLEARTINRKMSSLSSFFSFLRTRDKVDTNPTQTLSSLKVKKRLPNTLPEPDRIWMNRDGKDMDFQSMRDILIISILLQTGIRRAELISLRERDVQFEQEQLRIFGKGKKERLIPVHSKLLELIDQYIDKKEQHFTTEIPGGDVLLVTDRGQALYPKFVYRVVKKFMESQTTLQQKSPHVLRHTFATHLANEGADLNAIKTLLGHSNLAATQIYTHTSIERLKNVYKQAHPKGES